MLPLIASLLIAISYQSPPQVRPPLYTLVQPSPSPTPIAVEIQEAPETGFAAPPSGSVAQTICSVFGPYCSEAISVATCESTLNPAAVNGQYLGLFQMGSYARGRYGHGADALTQARAAYAYFMDAGADWSPWACKP